MNFNKNPANFNDTEKLLYLILQELKRIGIAQTEIITPELVSPVTVQETPTAPANQDKTHVCKKCGKKFPNMGKLLSHMKNDHPKGGK